MPGFRAEEHIRRREDFERVYKAGRRVSGRLMTIFVGDNGRTGARLGIAATRKFGPSVARNRAKRLIREVFRHHKPTWGADIVVVPRREMLDAPYVSLEAEFQALLERQSSAPRRTQESRGPSRTGLDSRL